MMNIKCFDRHKIRFLIVVLIIFSCKTNFYGKRLLVSDLNLISRVIIQSELKKDNSILLIDRADTVTPMIIDGYKSSSKEDNVIYWDKAMLPNVQYINKDSLRFYQKSVQTGKIEFKDFINKYNSKTIINLLIPIFNQDKSKAIIEVRRSNLAKESSSSSFYVLHRKESSFKIINEKLIDG